MPADRINLTEIQMVVHTGTDVDAPRHFFADGPALDEIPLERRYGPGVVLPIETSRLQKSGLQLMRAAPRRAAGEIVALHTGWSVTPGRRAMTSIPA